MGAINISFEGKPVFSWEGNEDAIAQILEEFPRNARSVGMSPRQLADNCVYQLANLRKEEESVDRQIQMVGVIWHILEQETNSPAHPGKIADYAARVDFDVDLQIGKQTAALVASGKFDA